MFKYRECVLLTYMTKLKESCCSNDITKESNAEQELRIKRVADVTNLLSAISYPSQEAREDAILSYCKCSLNLDELSKLVAPLRSDYRTEFNKASGVF